MSKKNDPDVLALKRSIRALDGCTSRRMVKATLDYLNDRYIYHPSRLLPEHLRPEMIQENESQS
jgi:hypothetical protein